MLALDLFRFAIFCAVFSYFSVLCLAIGGVLFATLRSVKDAG